ncbi:MAG: thioredoxin [Lachnospiraceae bacterium]|nr:thioredoxin [Lachnospiraceae bacterium]
MELKITNDNFKTEVLESELPVLVDFYADWCGPCKMMAPIINALASEYDGRFKIGKCNIEEEMAVAKNYNVMSIPTLIIFQNGAAKETIIGALSKNELADKLNEHLH